MRLTLYVYVEGKKTEISWLEHLARSCRAVNVTVNLTKGAGVPYTLLECAREKGASIDRRRDAASRNDEVWIVFDRDAHPRIPETWQGALENGVGMVFTNPCYELWPLLHLREFSGPVERDKLQKELHNAHPAFHHDTCSSLDWLRFAPTTNEAIERALGLHERHAKISDPVVSRPSTTAWLLHLRLEHAANEQGRWFFERVKGRTELLPLAHLLAEPLRGRVLGPLTPAPPQPAAPA